MQEIAMILPVGIAEPPIATGALFLITFPTRSYGLTWVKCTAFPVAIAVVMTSLPSLSITPGVLMTENGELIEIEYEIIDGVVVFETDLVGVFLFVDDEAAAA